MTVAEKNDPWGEFQQYMFRTKTLHQAENDAEPVPHTIVAAHLPPQYRKDVLGVRVIYLQPTEIVTNYPSVGNLSWTGKKTTVKGASLEIQVEFNNPQRDGTKLSDSLSVDKKAGDQVNLSDIPFFKEQGASGLLFEVDDVSERGITISYPDLSGSK